MKVFHSLGEAASLRGYALALGNFDGVHLGHRALFREAARHGPAGAVTFNPHPGKVLQPELAPKLITLLPRKLELCEEAGLDAAVVQPFSRAFAGTSSEGFEKALFEGVGASHVVVGGDFTYGQRRSGTVESLRVAAAAAGAELHVVPSLTVDGAVVSSSRIREYLLEGRVGAARTMLGRPFDLDGVVVRGQGRGRGLGFPTANVDTANELKPG
ncbi:MAG TPA: FAD synthetase family protein, partial [Myxococcaceae bacterium]|nr:FAD synthetase family protein [Myxococcaceae bacterium]